MYTRKQQLFMSEETISKLDHYLSQRQDYFLKNGQVHESKELLVS